MASTIGEKLRQAREEQERTLEEAAVTTRIRLRYLKAMEEGDFETLPSPFQQRGFLRSYAGFLGLNHEPLLEALSSGYYLVPETPAPTEDLPSKGEKSTHNQLEDIGKKLETQRNLLGFSLEDIERQIHIKPRYLQALEEGRFDELPSQVQGRGMLNNYAECLGLDPEPLLLAFAERLQARLEEKRSRRSGHINPSDTELQEPSWVQRVFSQHLIISGLFALVLVVVIIWSSVQVMGQRAGEAQVSPTIPGVADVLLPSATPSPTSEVSPTPQEGIQIDVEETSPPDPDETEEEEITPLPAEEVEIQVQLVIEQRAWVQVIADGEEVFSGRMLPGSTHVFGGEEQVEVLTGNAAGVRVFYNQREIGVLGVYGGVANLIFSAEGIYTPTPTITPTPEETATPTPTSTPSVTPTPSD